ncbi:MAG: decarboxylating 6-phosphogluconate dehydrogenase, partial [Candidatus Veblenbacteria bacterium]|nr:decarboxylating 6-phosphogluconate dehydrogenase [Candidatus Veblenbacteria bacterium]
WETIGVDARGADYDRTGAFTDVGQDLLLQLLALTTMGNPGALTAEAIRSARTLPLTSLLPLSPAQLKTNTFRSQYKGYRTIEGVTPDSTTETFFRINCALSQSQWSGVPITLEHGKRLGERRKEIVITFRHETPCLCPAGAHLTNKVTFSLEPYEGIRIQFWSKKPGHTYDVERSNLEFSLREVASGHTQYVKEYTKLLHDAIVGDQTLFLTATEVESMWRFTEPVVQAWRANLVPLNFYAPDTNEAPLQAQQLEPNRVRGLGGAPHARQLGLVGLGKMGGNIAQRLHELSWEVHAYNRTQAVTETFTRAGLLGAATLKELAASLTPPRVVWLALPAGPAVDDLLFGSTGLGQHLGSGDIVIEAGNSFYKDTIERHRKLAESGISLVDVGVSGGPSGARSGPTLMVGGEKEVVERLEPLFVELASPGGYQFFAGPGAGHFVKMVHNGIEYGMMQALAEGFTILKQASYQLDLTRVADIYNHGSVIESRLTDWLKQALSLHGPALPNITATVAHTGEAAWTVQTAQEMDIPAQIITEALEFRKQSEHNPSYTGKILSALRQQFGGHQAVETKEQPK